MVTPTKGFRRGTRRKLRGSLRHKFKPERPMKEFKAKEKVIIIADPSLQKTHPHPRFIGCVGEVIEKRGQSYIICLRIGGKEKKIIASPKHIKPVKNID